MRRALVNRAIPQGESRLGMHGIEQANAVARSRDRHSVGERLDPVTDERENASLSLPLPECGQRDNGEERLPRLPINEISSQRRMPKNSEESRGNWA